MISRFDAYENIESPNMYLCNPDQTQLFAIVGENRHVVLRFNDLSALTFTIKKNETNAEYYDLICSKRLIFVENIGWFQITNIAENTRGDYAEKSVTAESHQAALRTKGFVTEDKVYMFYNPYDTTDEKYNENLETNEAAIPSVVGQLCQQLNIKCLETLENSGYVPTEDYKDWTIIYIDPDLYFKAKDAQDIYTPKDNEDNICRSFDTNTTFGYDFIINDVEKAFQVVFEFDILYHAIKVRKLEDITKPTDIYLSFDNLVNTLSLTENADDIVTVMSCNGNGLDIRSVNPMGTNYIVNFDYYKGTCKQELVDKIILRGAKSSNEDIREFAECLLEDYNNYKAKAHSFSQTIFGNIDTNNRIIIEWTQQKYNENIDAINSFPLSIELGSYSTVLGMCETFGIDDTTVNIAFSPILQDGTSTRLLSKSIVCDYIFDLLEESLNNDGKEPLKEKILILDSIGKHKGDIFIKNLIADVGETAIITSEIMHYTGVNGSLNNDFNLLLEDLAHENQCQSEISAFNEFLENENNPRYYKWMSKDLTNALYNWNVEYKKWNNHIEERTNHPESFDELATEIENYYKEDSNFGIKIQKSNAKLIDLQNISAQFAALNEDKKSNSIKIEGDGENKIPKGFIVAETVEDGENSLLGTSDFFSDKFETNSDIEITGYTKAPMLVRVDDAYDSNGKVTEYHFEFDFDGTETGIENKPQLLIQNLTQDIKLNKDSIPDLSTLEVPLYFIDDNTKRSYCKLMVKSEVQVVNSGSVKIKDIQFEITEDEDNQNQYNVKNVITQEEFIGVNQFFNCSNYRFRIKKEQNNLLYIYCYYVSGFERYTTLKEVQNWADIWEKRLNTLKTERDEYNAEYIKPIEEKMRYIANRCNIEKYIKNEGEELYQELSNYWIEGNYDNSTLSVTETMDTAEKMKLSQELLKTGEIELQKVSQPTFEMSIGAINFLDLLEFKEYAEQLSLGAVVYIEKQDGEVYKPALTSIEFNLDDSNNFNLTFSNAAKPGETAMTFADLLKETSSTSRTVSSNWSNLTDYSRNKEKINSLIQDPLNRTLKSVEVNGLNQEFIIDNRGILGRKLTGNNSEKLFEDKQIRIVNNTILFTEDNWQTASLALGEVLVDDGNGGTEAKYGLVAETIVGELLLGNELKITNGESKTISIDGNGILIKNGGNTVFSARPDGNLELTGVITATSGTFNGVINANGGGTIGGYTIGEKTLTSGDGSIGMSSETDDGAYAFWAGNANPQISDFYVTNSGYLRAQQGSIGGWSINNSMIYSNTDDWFIYLQVPTEKGNSLLGDHNPRTVLEIHDKSHDSITDYPFLLMSDGTLYANKANVSGNINASSGTIGGININTQSISSTNGNFIINADGSIEAKNIVLYNAPKRCIFYATIKDSGGSNVMVNNVRVMSIYNVANIDNSNNLKYIQIYFYLCMQDLNGRKFSHNDAVFLYLNQLTDGEVASGVIVGGAVTGVKTKQSGNGATLSLPNYGYNMDNFLHNQNYNNNIEILFDDVDGDVIGLSGSFLLVCSKS